MLVLDSSFYRYIIREVPANVYSNYSQSTFELTSGKIKRQEGEEMNSAAILNDTMTLEEKLAAIDAAMKAAQDAANEEAKRQGKIIAPLDPASLTVCEGCS